MKFEFEQELYYRGVSYFRKQLFLRTKAKKGGSTLPVVPRQFERIVIPGLSSSNDLLCFYIGCTIVSYENDFAISEVLNHCIRMAQRYEFKGKWEIWLDYINYFGIETESSYSRNNKIINTCFDIPSIFDFLSLHYSDDEIFGNILNRSSGLIASLYKIQDRYKKDLRPVRRPQRKRGYNDKGSLAPFDSRARREANIEIEDSRDRRNFDSSSHIRLWGPLKHKRD